MKLAWRIVKEMAVFIAVMCGGWAIGLAIAILVHYLKHGV